MCPDHDWAKMFLTEAEATAGIHTPHHLKEYTMVRLRCL